VVVLGVVGSCGKKAKSLSLIRVGGKLGNLSRGKKKVTGVNESTLLGGFQPISHFPSKGYFSAIERKGRKNDPSWGRTLWKETELAVRVLGRQAGMQECNNF